ncbi:segregation/condensation protein A [Clostridium ljungdahlii]|uniref:Segregation and condensation protein A n=1 Tax=Clostridium ljungdahlii TaxID=1538 RepID=A0A162L256_9CLOT|nr:segregation/condensation protein A [Clostridium ljungdahlii]OAA83328.1 Segregation and condensation protein A [Clostridium ljungdahlii]
MSLNIKIENFEGPFDLLLHLIKKNKMNIYDIKIYEITEQYLQYVNNMRDMDLDVTSEFIVIAASLIEIKSKMLLPKTQLNEDDNEDEKDPRKELVDKLLQYKKFRAASEFLKKREIGLEKMFGKKPEIIEQVNMGTSPEQFLKGITMLDLYRVYSHLMDSYVNKLNNGNVMGREISLDKFKLQDKMLYIREIIQTKPQIRFSVVLKKCSFKIEKVVTFIALLELIKLKVVSVMQYENFDEIYVERVIENEK